MTTQDTGESLNRNMEELLEIQRGFKTGKAIDEIVRLLTPDAEAPYTELAQRLMALISSDETRDVVMGLLTAEWTRYKARKMTEPMFDVYNQEEPQPRDWHRRLLRFASADDDLLGARECSAFLWHLVHEDIDACATEGAQGTSTGA